MKIPYTFQSQTLPGGRSTDFTDGARMNVRLVVEAFLASVQDTLV